MDSLFNTEKQKSNKIEFDESQMNQLKDHFLSLQEAVGVLKTIGVTVDNMHPEDKAFLLGAFSEEKNQEEILRTAFSENGSMILLCLSLRKHLTGISISMPLDTLLVNRIKKLDFEQGIKAAMAYFQLKEIQ